jgi:hypothetical protein
MNSETADALRDFINDGSNRFSAEVLTFGSQAWVIVADKAGNDRRTFLEPVVDAGDYLSRAGKGVLQVDEELRDLLQHWCSVLGARCSVLIS